MFFQFFYFLVLVTLSFRIVLALLGLGAAAIQAIQKGSYSSRKVTIANQIIVCCLYSILVAVFDAFYVEKMKVAHPVVYGIIGFCAVFVILMSNLADKMRRAADSELVLAHVNEAAAGGASAGVILGLLAFPIAFKWPHLLTFAPGIPEFLGWIFSLADWLTTFWLVRLFILLIVVKYLFGIGMLILVGGSAATFAGFDHLRKAFARKSDQS